MLSVFLFGLLRWVDIVIIRVTLVVWFVVSPVFLNRSSFDFVCDIKVMLVWITCFLLFVLYGSVVMILSWYDVLVCFLFSLTGCPRSCSVILMWCLCGSRVFLFCLLWSGCYDIKVTRCVLCVCVCVVLLLTWLVRLLLAWWWFQSCR